MVCHAMFEYEQLPVVQLLVLQSFVPPQSVLAAWRNTRDASALLVWHTLHFHYLTEVGD